MKQNNFELAIENARWIIEKYWQANEGMMKRASTLVGLLGIELGVLGALNKRNFPDQPCFIYALILAGALIVLSIGFLLWSLRDKDFEFPEFEKLNYVHKVDPDKIHENVLEFILSPLDSKYGMYQNLHKENEKIANRFRFGSICATFGQFFLFIALAINWLGK
jgi:hypothetical protein